MLGFETKRNNIEDLLSIEDCCSEIKKSLADVSMVENNTVPIVNAVTWHTILVDLVYAENTDEGWKRLYDIEDILPAEWEIWLRWHGNYMFRLACGTC